MFLKNYTSEAPVHVTIHRIEQVLLQCGVTGISKEYGPNQKVLAVTFSVQFEHGKTVTIRLPAKEKECLEALWKDYVGGDKCSPNGQEVWSNPRKRKTKNSFAQQAERTAWKLMQDWVEVQMSMIQLNQADIREVFLAYIWDGRRTYFDALKEGGFRALLPEKTE